MKDEHGFNQLDKQISDTRKEIDGLLDCFIRRIFPLFGDQWKYYTILTVKLRRLQLKKEIDNSNVAPPATHNYKVVDGYKL